MEETFGSLQQEVDVKTKRLKKLFAKLQVSDADCDADIFVQFLISPDFCRFSFRECAYLTIRPSDFYSCFLPNLKATKQEIVDVQEEHVKERQELEQTQMELTRELKLKVLIIENFIPPEEKAKVRGPFFFCRPFWPIVNLGYQISILFIFIEKCLNKELEKIIVICKNHLLE